MKLQDAFVAETGAYYGSWTAIGYTIGQKSATCNNTACTGETNNFTFAQAGSYDASKNTAALSGSDVKVWTANNKVKLNDCTQGSTGAENWKLEIKQASGSTAVNTSGLQQRQLTARLLRPILKVCLILNPFLIMTKRALPTESSFLIFKPVFTYQS